MASEARRPPMSGVPAISDTVPSSFTVSDAQVSPPMLNQKPEATPRPCHLRSGVTSGFWLDRKSTRLNSSHGYISYAVFCLKKKKNKDYSMYTFLCGATALIKGELNWIRAWQLKIRVSFTNTESVGDFGGSALGVHVSLTVI